MELFITSITSLVIDWGKKLVKSWYAQMHNLVLTSVMYNVSKKKVKQKNFFLVFSI